jgi:hypothetical protein
MPELNIGSKIWYFDECHRVYRKDARGQATGSAVYRESWRQVEITGENRRSWITLFGKAPKHGAHTGWAFTQQELEKICWMVENKYRIVERLRLCDDLHKVMQVAQILGYVAEDNKQ